MKWIQIHGQKKGGRKNKVGDLREMCVCCLCFGDKQLTSLNMSNTVQPRVQTKSLSHSQKASPNVCDSLTDLSNHRFGGGEREEKKGE